MLVSRILDDNASLEGALNNLLAEGDSVGVVSITKLENSRVVVIYDSAKGFYSGQNAAVTTAVGALITAPVSPMKPREVMIQADSTNTSSIYIGDASSQYLELQAGAMLGLDWADLTRIFIKSGAGTQKANYFVRW